jgi:transcriptional regulator with XRE-family HTH domain
MNPRKRGRPRAALGDGFLGRLKELRLAARLSEQELCEWLGGLSRSTVGSWARGTRRPSWQIRGRVAKALDFLEEEVQRPAPRLPPPMGIRQHDRLAYVRKVRSSYPPV